MNPKEWKLGKIKHPLQYGTQKERVVARRLQRKGYCISLPKASRGASDIKARGPKRWDIQVKASLSCDRATLSPHERCRIKIQARKDNAVPVHAKVCGDRIEFRSVRTGKRLYPWGGEWSMSTFLGALLMVFGVLLLLNGIRSRGSISTGSFSSLGPVWFIIFMFGAVLLYFDI